MSDGEKLWLWKTGDHYLAFKHLYPCFEPGGDPMTLGEPSGYAIFCESCDRSVDKTSEMQGSSVDKNALLQEADAAHALLAILEGAGEGATVSDVLARLAEPPEKEWRRVMSDLLYAALERDSRNRIRCFDLYVDRAKALLTGGAE